ncbi:hypothetical protein NVP2130O_001, partial [Vibrio phage 2.130.O._10N.222.46.C2]
MFASIGQLFKALFMLGSVAERTMVGLDNVAKVGQAHSTKLLRDTLEDLDLDESDLEL